MDILRSNKLQKVRVFSKDFAEEKHPKSDEVADEGSGSDYETADEDENVPGNWPQILLDIPHPEKGTAEVKDFDETEQKTTSQDEKRLRVKTPKPIRNGGSSRAEDWETDWIPSEDYLKKKEQMEKVHILCIFRVFSWITLYGKCVIR